MEARLETALAQETQHAELPVDVEAPPEVVEPVEIPEAPVQAVANQLGGVAVDTVRLAELQLRLFDAELRQSAQQVAQPIVLLTATGVVSLASVVLLLAALATGLHHITGWSLALTQLIAALTGTLVAVTLAYVAWQQLKTPRISFSKSKDELMRNIDFITRMAKSGWTK